MSENESEGEVKFDPAKAIGVVEAAKLLRGRGRKPATVKSVRRWAAEGRRCCDGIVVVLRSTRLSGDILTMPEWVAEFERQSAHHNDTANRAEQAKIRAPRSRAAAHRRAEAMLDKMGVK